MFHDFCQSVTLVFCQRTHVSHDHHPRGPCCSRARISYDEPCMGAIFYQKIFASALTIAQTATLTEEQGHPYVVRTTTNSTIIGRTAALAASRGPWKTYYFIGPDYEWGHRVNADFWEFLQHKKEGVQKVGDLWPKLGERDFSSHITTMLNAKPDAVFSSLWGGDLIAFVKQANTYGFFDKVQFVSTSAGDLDILKPLGAEMPDGLMATFMYAFDMPIKGKEKDNQEFVAKFKQRAGYEPKTGDMFGYVSTYMMAEAIEQTGSTA